MKRGGRWKTLFALELGSVCFAFKSVLFLGGGCCNYNFLLLVFFVRLHKGFEFPELFAVHDAVRNSRETRPPSLHVFLQSPLPLARAAFVAVNGLVVEVLEVDEVFLLDVGGALVHGGEAFLLDLELDAQLCEHEVSGVSVDAGRRGRVSIA